MMLPVNGIFRAQRLEAQEAQKDALDNIRGQRSDTVRHKKQKWVESCKYYRTGQSKR